MVHNVPGQNWEQSECSHVVGGLFEHDYICHMIRWLIGPSWAQHETEEDGCKSCGVLEERLSALHQLNLLRLVGTP